MSLSRALSTLSPDDHTERVLRDILTLFGHHKREWLSEHDVQSKTGHTLLEIHQVLPVLKTCYVLDFDSAEQLYRYNGDVVLDFEIDAFMRQVDYHQSHVRSNVARFRERQGY
ncbi:hypothetical protein EG835_00625 [bacterium]|nr:hypothetical protein [bacterium]